MAKNEAVIVDSKPKKQKSPLPCKKNNLGYKYTSKWFKQQYTVSRNAATTKKNSDAAKATLTKKVTGIALAKVRPKHISRAKMFCKKMCKQEVITNKKAPKTAKPNYKHEPPKPRSSKAYWHAKATCESKLQIECKKKAEEKKKRR